MVNIKVNESAMGKQNGIFTIGCVGCRVLDVRKQLTEVTVTRSSQTTSTNGEEVSVVACNEEADYNMLVTDPLLP